MAKEIDIYNPKIRKQFDKILNHKNLTTPKSINNDIKEFCKNINHNETPFFLIVKPEEWSRQSCCDLNVKEYIQINSGEMLCGYKIWFSNPVYIEAERHAVWFKDGVYKDITFNAEGESEILFIPDVIEKRNSLDLNRDKIRWGKNAIAKALTKSLNDNERLNPIPKMSDEDSWNKMITYKDWLNGKRMSNYLIQ